MKTKRQKQKQYTDKIHYMNTYNLCFYTLAQYTQPQNYATLQ